VFTLAKTNENGVAETWPTGLTVTVTGGTWNATNRTITVSRTSLGTGNADFSIAISGLTASSTAATLHYFTLAETAGGGAGWTNATNEYLLRVNVPSGGGTSSINAHKTRASSTATWGSFATTGSIYGTSANRAAYTNSYTPPATGNATIPGTKILTGTPASSTNFVFTLTHTSSSGSATALPSGMTISGTVIFSGGLGTPAMGSTYETTLYMSLDKQSIVIDTGAAAYNKQ